MSHHYYYFISSLPVLDFESKAPMSVENFLKDCQRLIPEDDYDAIRRLWAADPTQDAVLKNHPVVRACVEQERAIRNEGVYARAAKWNVDPAKHVRGERTSDPAIISLVQQALNETDLIKAERMMDNFRWRTLSEMQTNHYFDAHCAFIYAMKLKILDRWQNFKSPVGREIWQNLKQVEIPKQFV